VDALETDFFPPLFSFIIFLKMASAGKRWKRWKRFSIYHVSKCSADRR
jgi:hypothetical protein